MMSPLPYFPHLIAGPIIHHKEVMPQFGQSLRFDWRCVNIGLLIFLVGLIKKVLFADNLALICDPIFLKSVNGSPIAFLEGWVGALAYTFQLYFDFSGYCDMAIGLSYALGIKLPINFYSPYKAKNIIDFWRRWHITLSRFLRDYVYIPLGGSRHGHARRFTNLFATMFIGGIWHGAGWTFIVWGTLHGLYLIINHGWLLIKNRLVQLLRFTLPQKISTVASWGITFLAVVIAWVFFRAKTLSSAKLMLAGMFGFNSFALDPTLLHNTLLLIGCVLFVIALPNTQEMFRRYRPALYLNQDKTSYQKFNFANLFTRYIGNPLSKRGVPSTLYTYSLLCYLSLTLFFCLGVYQFNFDKKIYAMLPDKNNNAFIDNTKGSFRHNLFSNYVFANQFKDYQKIIVLGSSYTTNMTPKTFEQNGQHYLSTSLGIGGNSLLNGFRTAFAILDEPGIKMIIFGVSPLGFGKVSQDAVAFNDEGLDWLRARHLTFTNYFRLYRGKDNHITTFLDYLKMQFLSPQNSQNPVVTITLTEPAAALSNINTLAQTAQPQPVKNQQNGADATFHWQSRGIFESMQTDGDVYTLFKQLKQACDQRHITLIVYETPTSKHDTAPQVYPAGFFEQYQTHVTQMFTALSIKYFDISDFLPWDNQFMADFIHAQIPMRNLIHEYVLNLIFEESSHNV